MELRSLRSPCASSILSANWRAKLFLSGKCGKLVKIPDCKRDSSGRKLRIHGLRAQCSGTIKDSSMALGVTPVDSDSKDENLVFVAGATGRVGSRTVRELLKLGFKVRAGVRSTQRAGLLLDSIERMNPDAGTPSEGPKPIERLEIVECNLEKREQIKPGLGNASIVICCIGASEKEIFDITGPYRIDYQATKNLIDTASAAKVHHFILLTSLGTNKVGFPAAILNLFWGVLIWKRKAEEALLASDLPYTIVRPGGMERPTDAYKETHNIILSEEDTLFGGQVSNLQVAELMAFMATNCSLSYCKVVEVIAETTAPLLPMGDLLAKIPSQRAEVKPQEQKDAADRPLSVASESVVLEPPSLPVQKEPSIGKTMAAGPLSPYTMYEDLKPPVSPTPKPSTSTKAVNINEVPSAKQVELSEPPVNAPTETEVLLTEVIKSSPLSPYTAYADLKPPSSPSPTPSGSTEVTPKVVSEITGGSGVAKTTSSFAEQDPSLAINSHLSPYTVYDDLKPPTSPCPTAPNGSPSPPSSPNEPKGEHHDDKPKTRPLSPFPMYEDLKPPTSPCPVPKN